MTLINAKKNSTGVVCFGPHALLSLWPNKTMMRMKYLQMVNMFIDELNVENKYPFKIARVSLGGHLSPVRTIYWDRTLLS